MMRQGLRLLLARFLTNCFANEALKSGLFAHVLKERAAMYLP